MSEIRVDRNLSVETTDGVALATDVYRPDDDAEYPVLVHRNPYDKSNAKSVGGLIVNPLDAVEAGFAVVVQDVRGRFASEGKFKPFQHEREDGYRTVEWAASQPWSNGHVGVYGASYHGVTALQAAAADPPHLDAVFAYSTGCNYQHGFIYENGTFKLGFNLYWALGLTQDEEQDVDDVAVLETLADARANPEKYATKQPLTSILPTDEIAQYWREWLDHPEYDEYWEAIDVGPQVADVDCPVMHLSGWYDVFLQGHLDLERRLRADGSDHHRFVVGPWNHEAYTTLTPSKIGDRVFGPNAVTGTGLMSDLALDWFDRWLADDPKPDQEPPVQYFQMGTDEWRETNEWPPAHNAFQIYLRGDARSANSATGGLSRTKPATDQPPDSYRYDPEDPVPTRGGRIHQPILDPGGVRDQTLVLLREDVLSYIPPRLTEPIAITGPVKCRLYVACSRPDVDLVTTLVDVDPSGYHANIADGVVRARYRNNTDEPEYFEPGSCYAVTVDMGAVAYTFNPGHRVSLAVTSSDFPRFDRNTTARGPIAHASPEAYQPADVQVYHDSNRLSHLLIPEVKD